MVIGPSIFYFQLWTSLLFVSTSNFIVPLVIYLRCNEFRKKYNKDRRVLTKKQQHLLKKIHYQSIAINKWVDNQRALNQQLAMKEKMNQARLGKNIRGAITINGVLAKINLDGAPSKKHHVVNTRDAGLLNVPPERKGSASIKDPHFVYLLGGYDKPHNLFPNSLLVTSRDGGTFIENPVIFSDSKETGTDSGVKYDSPQISTDFTPCNVESSSNNETQGNASFESVDVNPLHCVSNSGIKMIESTPTMKNSSTDESSGLSSNVICRYRGAKNQCRLADILQ